MKLNSRTDSSRNKRMLISTDMEVMMQRSGSLLAANNNVNMHNFTYFT